MDTGHLEARKARARSWFEALRDEICAAFETLEDALPASAPLGDGAPAASCARPGTATTIPALMAAAESWR